MPEGVDHVIDFDREGIACYEQIISTGLIYTSLTFDRLVERLVILMQTGGGILVSGEDSHMLHANQRISKTEVLAGQASFTENCTTRPHNGSDQFGFWCS